MTDFSAGAAGVAGLRLIVRKPLAILAWGLTYLVLYGLPLAGMMMFILHGFGLLLVQKPGPGFATSPAFLALISQAQGFNGLMIVCSLIARSLVASAICRAVLEPQNSAYGYLRLGMREVWVGLVMLVVGVILALTFLCATIAAAIPLGIIALIAHSVLHGAGWALLLIGAIVIGFGITIWVGLRFSLSAPMSYAQTSFMLTESWTATRGLEGRLLVTGLIAAGCGLLFEFAFIIVGLVVVLVVTFGAHLDFAAFARAAHGDPATWMAGLAPWLIGWIVAICLLVGAMMTIVVAPFAAAYRAIAKPAGGA